MKLSSDYTAASTTSTFSIPNSDPIRSRRLRYRHNIPHLVFQSTPTESFCAKCRISAIEFVENSYRWYQNKTRNNLAVNDIRFGYDQNRRAEGVDTSMLLQQIKLYRDRAKDLNEYFVSVKLDEMKLQQNIKEKIDDSNKLILDSNEINFKKRALIEQIVDLTVLSQRTEREAAILHSHIHPLVIVLVPDLQRSKQFSSAHTINGYALSLYPNMTMNITWEEINAAWGLVGLSIVGIIRKLNISNSRVKYLVSSLRNKVIIRRYQVVCNEETKIAPEIRSSDHMEEAVLGMTLILEGGDKGQPGSKHSNYIEAVAALAVVVASLAQVMKKTEKLVGLLTRVIPVIEKYGPDVIVNDHIGSDDKSRSPYGKTSLSKGAALGNDLQSFGHKAELLPHWRFLFFSSAERASTIGHSPATRHHPKDIGGFIQSGNNDIAIDILETIKNILH